MIIFTILQHINSTSPESKYENDGDINLSFSFEVQRIVWFFNISKWFCFVSNGGLRVIPYQTGMKLERMKAAPIKHFVAHYYTAC